MYLLDNTKYQPVEDPNLSPLRTKNEKLTVKERLRSFREIEQTYSEEQAAQEAQRCFSCPTHWCENRCPAGVPVPDFIAKIRAGDLKGAYQTIRTHSAFPEICARVCPQEKQCQMECTRSICGEAVGIGNLERFVAEAHYEAGWPEAEAPATGKTVAVVGSGPSGLSAAQFLADLGHEVTVFEKDDRIGGLLEYGIPNMKLEKGVVARKVAALQAQGVRFVPGAKIGVDISGQELIENYDAVLLCVGTGTPRPIYLEGSKGVREIISAVEYLTAGTRSVLDPEWEPEEFHSAQGKRVVILGAGDTGNDCVGTALRQKCCSVIQLEMLPQCTEKTVILDPIPRRPKEKKQDSSQIEYLTVFGKAPQLYQTTVKRIHCDETGMLSALTIISLEPQTGAHGRTEMVEVLGTERTLPCDMLIVAAGFLGPEEYVAQEFGVERDERSNIRCKSYATNVKKVFACGDCRTGQSLVVKAMTDGRQCAQAVHIFLQEQESEV